jgi:murein DD-endopeptidase MepM/ murein hydrolase activator NlpD
LYDDSKLLPILSFSSQGDHFLLSAGNYKDPKRRVVLIHTYRIVGSEFGVLHEEKNSYLLSPQILNNITNTEKPFSFPFERLIGVTQWYGNTAFQTPHTGIDFGAREENVLAVEKGEIVSKGWDSYFGECNSGGNYLRVKQENGMNTVYFHLAESYVNTGDMVKKGDIIAKSGNSGAWNCQPLGYHLHFETRLNQNMNSHDNPVKYINADWDSIPTLNYKQIPGRLTGENPHPGR